MALIHPRSLERWQEWRSTRRRAPGVHEEGRRALRPLRPRTVPSGYVLHTRDGEAGATGRVLLGVDLPVGTTPEGLLAALPYMHGPAMVLTRAGTDLDEVAGPEWRHESVLDPTSAFEGAGITSVITLGWHLGIGHLVHEWALGAGVPAAVVQDDVLTPYAAPLPPETTVLAWSEEDGDFHRAQRDDIDVRVVGSQRLWQAAHESAVDADSLEDQPVFLGQLGAIELPRRLPLATADSYCRSAGALYQPGVLETDRIARAAHALLHRRGIEFQSSGIEVRDQNRPLVSMLSADVLEAAVRGLPAWVHGPKLPAWVHEHWERYGMRPTGGDPTPAPPLAADEPARLIAQILEGTA
ncbi:hypothetical protein ACTXKL_05375 [Brachybacterium tyrofermentans]|uniref:hypothetical protein n=1 Tax=Brachybacterium tyrofermentans TaxID=47848 RepID=UPI003FD4E075